MTPDLTDLRAKAEAAGDDAMLSVLALLAEARDVVGEVLGVAEVFVPVPLDAPGFRRARELHARLGGKHDAG
jgi:hypothetical protein